MVLFAGTMYSAAGEVSYTTDQTGTISAPALGIGANSTHYILTGSGVSRSLDKNFTGNNQETPIFTNPNNAIDSASFDDTYTLQLGTDANLRKVRISDGALTAFNGHSSLDLGSGIVGIGYYWRSNEKVVTP